MDKFSKERKQTNQRLEKRKSGKEARHWSEGVPPKGMQKEKQTSKNPPGGRKPIGIKKNPKTPRAKEPRWGGEEPTGGDLRG